jgi:uncharacterized iron-regulated membrane protein
VLTNEAHRGCRFGVALEANANNGRTVAVVAQYAWALWLAGPVVATALAAVWVWWRGRPAKTPRPKQAIAEHQAYLDALRRPAVDRLADEHAERAPAVPRRSPSVAPQPRSTVTR